MTNKKKIVLTILACIFIALACIFGFTIANKQDLNVKADTVSTDYTFNGSDLPVFLSTFRSQNTNDVSNYVYVADFRLDHLTYFGDDHIGFACNLFFSSSTGIANSNDDIILYAFNITRGASNVGRFIQSDGNSSRWYFIATYCTSSFIPDVVKVEIYNDTSSYTNLNATTIKYYDRNNEHLWIKFFYNNSNDEFYFVDRTYYFDNYFSDNQYFNAGYDNGYSAGTSVGYDNGYSAGSQSAQTNAYNVGYNAGVEAANTYSFFGMIGAAFDVPINAFKEMFDFNVLGVNLKDFFLGIFSLIIIIFVVRLILGGK